MISISCICSKPTYQSSERIDYSDDSQLNRSYSTITHCLKAVTILPVVIIKLALNMYLDITSLEDRRHQAASVLRP